MVFPRALAASLIAIALGLQHPAQAQNKQDIQNAVEARFHLSKLTSDKTDLRSQGSVLVLLKDRVLMNKASAPLMPGNVYRNGKVQGDGLVAITSVLDATSTNGPSHYFPAGEKLFITGIETRADAVSLTLMSGFRAVTGERDQRFHGTLKFPFPKGTLPAAGEVLTQIAEVVRIEGEPQDEAPMSLRQPGMQPSEQQPAAPQPGGATLAKGMSRDQVIALLGVPSKIVHAGDNEIDVFPDLKVVTFVNGKVADIQ